MSVPKHLKEIESSISEKLKYIKKPNSEVYEMQQLYFDEVFKIYQEAFQYLVHNTITFSKILNEIKNAYENALQIRDKRISQFITQDRVFGISVRKNERDSKVKDLIVQNDKLKEENLELASEVASIRKEMGKLKDDNFSDYLALMRERDAKFTLYYENLELQMKVKELDGSSRLIDQTHGDPVVLRIALDRCREQLTKTQMSLARVTEEYSDTVPRRDYDALDARHCELVKALDAVRTELLTLQENYDQLSARSKCVEEECSEARERARELERAGTPRPRWDLCADFIGGGRDRWCELARGLSSRDTLLVLLRELGPAADTDHLEHFEGLGTDPSIPPYLRYEGSVRNLRLSRRELSVIINDIWRGKADHMDMTMQDYVTKYFEDRYQQPSVRAEWAYNLCAGAEQSLDEPQVKLFWAVLHSALSERIYWGLRDHWRRLRDQLYSAHSQTVTIEQFEKAVKTVFPLKSEVDVKSLCDVVRRQLKLKLNQNELHLDKIFQENEEGFDRSELSRELYRQRQLAQDRYLREVAAALPARRGLVSVDDLKRAFAIVDPAIDHIRMERYIRWAFSDQSSDTGSIQPAPWRRLAARLAAGDVERAGPRYRAKHRRHYRTYPH